MNDDDGIRQTASIVLSVNQVDEMSVDELQQRITLMVDEIDRLRHVIEQKNLSKVSAESFFKS